MKSSSQIRKDFSEPERGADEPRTEPERTAPSTCIETIGGDPETAIRLTFQIKVF